jgi:hypothetical protein
LCPERSNIDEISQPYTMDGSTSFPYRPAANTERQETGENNVQPNTGTSNPTDGTLEWQEAGHVIVVSPDHSRIWSPDLQRLIPMPQDPQDKKQAFIDVFLYFSKVLFFLDVDMDLRSVFHFIPEILWNTLFTATETTRFIKAQGKTFRKEIAGRLVELMEEWRLLDGFPAIPISWQEIVFAKSQSQRNIRKSWFRSLLEEQTEQSDRYFRHVWQNFLETAAFEPALHPANPFRSRMVEKLATLSEKCFVHCIIRDTEEELRIARLREILDDFRKAGVVISEDEGTDEDTNME